MKDKSKKDWNSGLDLSMTDCKLDRWYLLPPDLTLEIYSHTYDDLCQEEIIIEDLTKTDFSKTKQENI